MLWDAARSVPIYTVLVENIALFVFDRCHNGHYFQAFSVPGGYRRRSCLSFPAKSSAEFWGGTASLNHVSWVRGWPAPAAARSDDRRDVWADRGRGAPARGMMSSTMDRISNKFKLVRSQSIGVGMGGEGGKVVVRAEGRPAQIVLLDERRVELTVQPRLYAGELLDLVASQCGLKVQYRLVLFLLCTGTVPA